MNEFTADDARIIKSIKGDGCKIYSRAELLSSSIGNYVTIGNDTVVQDSFLTNNISINRRNFIHRTKMGAFCYTGIGTSIRSSEVGNFCSISWGVSIGGGEHPHDKVTTSTLSRFHFLDVGYRDKEASKALTSTYEKQTPCKIGNDVLISSNAVILRDITVGNGAIIGAGAVVTKDVEPYSIVAGVPAKKIKMRFNDKTIEALEELKWWDWPIEVIRQNLDLIYSKKVNEQVIEQLKEISNSLK